ncbi:MAG: metallophosphoesterase [Akkermansiaceae bacterium]|nr:metallophosphoesterase [Akkermansiaceae bacterium]MCP5545114.1 metallophosphoesterase [Akkermansiaceae bacterium]MCP5546665.1 metallophosphoesterase [Akkermansiaceae bacterium]
MSRILHLSDPHFGAVSLEAAQTFLREAGGLAPDLTILSGDLTMRARRGELSDAKRFVDSLPTPLLVIPGNHDIPALNQPFDRFFAPFRRYRETISPALSPTLRVPGVHAVGVNSSIAFGRRIDWSTGHLSHENFRHIAKGFTTGTHEGDLRVLVLHHPLLAPPGHRRAVVQPMPRLLETMSRHRIDLVLCGHFHVSLIATIGTGWSTVVSQAPTVCSTRLQGEPPGFHLITTEADELAIELRQFDGNGFTPSHTKRFRRVADGWQAADGRPEI